MKFFIYDKANGELNLENAAILTIKELGALLESKRNITKTDKTGKLRTLAFKELKYIYLFFDWDSPYFSFAEQQRSTEALNDSGLTELEFNDPIFRDACKKYNEVQNSSLEIRMLRAAMIAVENQIYYLEHIDLQERDLVTGKPIFKSKDLIVELKGCKDLIASIRELELQVKKGVEVGNNLRGNAEPGILD